MKTPFAPRLSGNLLSAVFLAVAAAAALNFWFFDSMPLWIAVDMAIVVLGAVCFAGYVRGTCNLSAAVLTALPAVVTAAIVLTGNFAESQLWVYVDVYIVVVYSFLAGSS